MEFGNKFWLILFQKYIIPKLFAEYLKFVCFSCTYDVRCIRFELFMNMTFLEKKDRKTTQCIKKIFFINVDVCFEEYVTMY